MGIKAKRLGLSLAVGLVGATGTMIRDAAAQSAALEEIVVTATRRATNVQDVPLAITALTDEGLRQQNLENLQNITAAIPNVLIYGGGGASTESASINMRGIPGVGVYVDGIWQVSTAGLLLRPFTGLDRIEVLRGPQGTLYGRDSTGGSIHLYTKLPQKEFGGAVDVSVGDFHRRDASASIDLPITDKFRTKWSLAQYDRDGFIGNVLTGVNSGDYHDSVGHADLYWEPTDRFNARLTWNKDDIVSTPAKVIDLIYPRVAWQDGTQVGIAQMFDIASGGRFNNTSAVSGGGVLGEFQNREKLHSPDDQQLQQTTFTVNYRLTDNLNLKYLFGQTDVLNEFYFDYAGSEFDVFLDHNLQRTKLNSHEFQITGGKDRMHWSAGVYHWDQSMRTHGARSYQGGEFLQAPNQGLAQTLDYNTVLASPACQATAASYGYDFAGRRRFNGAVVGAANGPDSWVIPCNGFFGHGMLDLLQLALGRGDTGQALGQKGDAYFGEVTFDLTNKWDLTVGTRYHQQDNTTYTVDVLPGIAAGLVEPTPPYGQPFRDPSWALGGNLLATGAGSTADPATRLHFDNTSYRFGTSYHVRDSLMFYVAYNEGFNSGGTNRVIDSLGVAHISNYDPEIIKNREIGMRSLLLNRKLKLNVAIFDTDWLGVHINAQAIDPVTGSVLTQVTTQNAADGQAKGADVEFSYSPTAKFNVGVNLGFLSTGYTRVQSGLTEAYNLDTTFTGAPDHTYDFSVAYNFGFKSGGSLLTRVGYSYVGQYERSSLLSFREASIVPGQKEAGDFWMLNLRAIYKPSDSRYEISLYGTNLTNAYNLNSGFMHRFWNFDFATVDSPREVGVGFRVHF